MCDIHALSVLKNSAIDFAMCNIRECTQKKSHFHANFHTVIKDFSRMDTTTVSTKVVFSPLLVRTLLIRTDEFIL
jgi:hypothetical protein